MPTINGNDVSQYQGIINYDTYKNNTNFVVIKASEGSNYLDPAFKLNQKEARRVGLEIGYYHFGRPDLNNLPETEADFFLQTVGKPLDGEFFALDYECPNQKQADVDWCLKFMNRVNDKIGVKCLIYLNKSILTRFNWHSVVAGNFGLWLAVYSTSPLDTNFNTGSWPFMSMRQWTNSQIVPGIADKVDGDVFFGDLPTLKKYGYQTPVITPPTDSPEVIALKQQVAKLQSDNDTLNTGVTILTNRLSTLKLSIRSAVDTAIDSVN